jgi:hypothetical protein
MFRLPVFEIAGVEARAGPSSKDSGRLGMEPSCRSREWPLKITLLHGHGLGFDRHNGKNKNPKFDRVVARPTTPWTLSVAVLKSRGGGRRPALPGCPTSIWWVESLFNTPLELYGIGVTPPAEVPSPESLMAIRGSLKIASLATSPVPRARVPQRRLRLAVSGFND